MPTDSVFDAIVRLHAELDEVRALLTGPEASVRIVLTPESVVLAEARRSWTTLSLYGYRVDGVVANRVFPAGRRRRLAGGLGGGPGRRARRGRGVLRRAAAVALRVPPRRAGRRTWPCGDLAAETYGGDDPLAVPEGDGPFRMTSHASGTVLHLALPLARPGPTSTSPATATTWW